jgi:hypothetical protein
MKTSWLDKLFLLGFSVVILCVGLALTLYTVTPATAQVTGLPTLSITNGIFEGTPKFQPLLFIWASKVRFSGENWGANDTLTIHMYGPLNTLGVMASDRALGQVFTDGEGNIVPGIDYDPVVQIPYDLGTIGSPNVTRPGRYTIYAQDSRLRSALAQQINLCPRTIPFFYPNVYDIHWSASRGGRDGFLGDHSPERTDPEWISVWSEAPVAMYGTIANAFVSHEDYPNTHYGHDADLVVQPDEEYRWVLGDANFAGDPGSEGFGLLEFEWETQNSGSPTYDGYGKGNIGLPLWAMPTVGDRVFTVGRWIMDNGHPDTGDRTEIHPFRLLATMRQRDTVVPAGPLCTGAAMTRASQVDIFVSGHGGGANQFSDGLSAAIDNNGFGGGRIEDVLTDPEYGIYTAAGPGNQSTYLQLAEFFSGINSGIVQSVAGPSGLGWTNGPEERPINDMDYDFDVPLPAPPAGATSVQVQVITHTEHTTEVSEVITYTHPDPATGLPTTAHIHLPYKGADNGIYARTLNFYWDVFNPPGRHFEVKLNRIDFFLPLYMSGKDYIWADSSGQWLFLTQLNPDGFLHANEVLSVYLPDTATWDVYLDPADKLRVYAQGYDYGPFDDLMGFRGDVNQTSRPAYDVASDLLSIAIANQISLNPRPSNGDSEDLGGALFEGLPIPTSPAAGGIRGDHFSIGPYFVTYFNVSYVPNPHIQVSGQPVDFGSVCTGSSADRIIRITNGAVGLDNNDPYANAGIDTLNGTLTLSGADFSLVPPSFSTSFGLDAGQHEDVTLRFSPTLINQVPGSLTVNSNDSCQPSLTVPLTGTVIYPATTLTGSLNFGVVPIGNRAPRSSKLLNFLINDTGVCPLIVNAVAVTGGDISDFYILAPTTFPATIPPGESLPVSVEFNPTKGGHRTATISVTLGNDPANVVPLTITAEGGAPPPPPHP